VPARKEGEVILVVGATGIVGSEICRQLVTGGTPVRALVRPSSDAARVTALRELGAEVVEGDVRDGPSLADACAGVDGVVCTISSMPFAYVPGVNDIASVDVAGLHNLVDAAEAADVRRFVYLSFSGGLDLPFPLGDAKRTVEGRLQASRLDWTILRPSYFMEVWLSPAVGFDPEHGTVVIYGTGEAPISWISARDVAAFAAASLRHPAASRAVIELGGHPVAPLDVVRIYESVLGRPLAPSFVTEQQLDQQLAAATDPMQASFAGLMRCYAMGDPIEMGKAAEILPRPMVTVGEYAAAVRAGVSAG
jgi:uncharacterized protein YbjT (DUF2867 family)